MSVVRRDDLLAFKAFIESKIAAGPPSPTPDECLELWLLDNVEDQEDPETLEAIRRGLDDVSAGRTRPAREAIAELRRELNLPGAT